MVGPPLDWTFPFGRPVGKRRPSAKSARRVYVLGAFPSALHIAWWSPARKVIKALAVVDEPAPFWNGADERAQIEAWKKLVGFRIGEWGEVETAGEVNGKVGRWLEDNVLSPLGVARDEVCLSYCLDRYLTDAAVAFAVNERYQPLAAEMGWPRAHLSLRPRDGAFATLAVEEHGERLRHELSMVVPEIVVTLGNVALRVLRAITDPKAGPGRLHPDASYGAPQPLPLRKRKAELLALTHHEVPPAYAEAHARWLQSRHSSRNVTTPVARS